MNILFLSNNEISNKLYLWLKELEENVFLFTKKLSKKVLDEYKPDFIISYNYKYIIKEELLLMFPNKFINLHISYLPWNRGAHPNIWSFLHDTPKGVSIHFIDKGIDTGDIICQKEVIMETNETLLTSYNKLNNEIQHIFIENWAKIKNNKIEIKKQVEKGSTNYLSDFEKIKHILGSELWNIKIDTLKKRFEYYKNESNLS